MPGAKKPKGPAVDHSLVTVSGPSAASCAIVSQRARRLTKDERAQHREDRPRDVDRVLVYTTAQGFARRDKAPFFEDVWLARDRVMTVALRGGLFTCAAPDDATPVKFPLEGSPRMRLAGCDGVGEAAWNPMTEGGPTHVLWWRPLGKDWSALPLPDRQMVLHVVITPTQIWIGGGGTLAVYDGTAWRTVPAEVGAGWFTHFAVGAAGELCAVRGDAVYRGDASGIAPVLRLPVRDAQVAHFAGAFWIGAGADIARLDGTVLTTVASTGKTSHSVRLSARDSLLALTVDQLLESVDGTRFEERATAKQIGEVAGTADVKWLSPSTR